MSYKNNSSYVQKQTNVILRFYKYFVKIYIDDIIIFNRTLKKHLKHLRIIFELFRNKKVNLFLIKSFFDYSFITLLKQWVDSFEMSISTKKIVAIISLRFSHILRDFEIFLKLTEWLRSSILYYAQRSLFLQKRKISLIKNMSKNDKRSMKKKTTIKIRYDFSNEKQKIFRNIKFVFEFFTFLTHFNKIRRLYIDLNAFKKWNFVVMIYHV